MVIASGNKGCSIQSSNGVVDLKFRSLWGDDDIPEKHRITTITGPDGSKLHIIYDLDGKSASEGTYASKLSLAIHDMVSDNPTWPLKYLEKQTIKTDKIATPLDEAKTAELWKRVAPRYYVSMVTDQYPGYKLMTFMLFHNEMKEKELLPLVVLAADRTKKDFLYSYPASHVEQTFSEQEVRQIRDYFPQHYKGTRIITQVASPPDNNCAGYGAMAVGGSDDFYMFSKEDGYNLPFKVWGYFRKYPDQKGFVESEIRGSSPR